MATETLIKNDSFEFGEKQLHASTSESITGFKKLLGIGPRSGMLCNKMLSHDFLSVALKDFSTASEWILQRKQYNKPLPDAILYDINLDGEDTFKNVQRLKKFSKTVDIPIILITKDSNEEERLKALKAGADDYYSTLVSTEDLNYRILFLKKLNDIVKSDVAPREAREVQMPRIWGMKRLFDIAVSITLLILLIPVFAVIAVLIRMDSKGPIFYISKRAGAGYKVFNFYKFRTMKCGADKELQNLKHQNQYSDNDDALFFKIEKDPRITKIGSFLRNTSLDELPQIINVLKGDMSLVGNRPLPLYEAMQLTKDQWAMRFNAPAGITGLWQVTKRGKKNMSEEERIKLDISYATRNSFLFDIKILFKTLPAAIQKENV